jgi:hypothetical protein
MQGTHRRFDGLVVTATDAVASVSDRPDQRCEGAGRGLAHPSSRRRVLPCTRAALASAPLPGEPRPRGGGLTGRRPARSSNSAQPIRPASDPAIFKGGVK